MDSKDRSDNEEGTAAESSAGDTVTLVVQFEVPGAGPRRVDVDGRAMRREGDFFTADVAPGGHALDWAARGQPDTDYLIAIREPRSAAWMRWLRTDDAGRAAGHKEFSIAAAEDESFDEDFAFEAGIEPADERGLESVTKPVKVEVTLVVPGAGPKRVDLDLRAMPRTGDDTFATKAGPGKHSMDWAGQGQPNSEYSVTMSVDGKEVFKRKGPTDERGRTAGHKGFTI